MPICMGYTYKNTFVLDVFWLGVPLGSRSKGERTFPFRGCPQKKRKKKNDAGNRSPFPCAGARSRQHDIQR